GLEGRARITALMDGLRRSPPSRIGSFQVTAVRDYLGRRRTATNGAVTSLTLPESNVLAFELEGGGRVVVRPSGTEPKIKFYFDHREVVRAGEVIAIAQQRAKRILAELAAFAKL